MSGVRTYLNLGITTLRYEGPLVLAVRVAKLLGRPFGVLIIVSLFHKDLAAPVESLQPRAKIDIGRLAEADVSRLAVVVAHRESLDPTHPTDVAGAEREIRRRLEAGGLCFLALGEGEIVHYNWVFPGVTWQAGPNIRFEPATSAEALCDDAFTLEGWRGRGIHAAVHAAMLQHVQRSGCTTSYTPVSTDNRSSRKALERLGYVRDSTVILFVCRRSGRKRIARFGRPLTRFRVGE